MFQRPVGGAQVSFTPTQIPTNLMQMSAGGSMRDVGCAELGGFRGWTNTPTPGCYTNTAETEELVTEQNSYNLYIEHNLEAGGLRFHTEALVYRQDIPNIALAGTFVNNPDAWPLAPSLNGAPRVQQNVNGTNAYFVPGTNPAVANLLTDLRNPDARPRSPRRRSLRSPTRWPRDASACRISCGSRSATAAHRAATSIARKVS